MQTTFQCVYVSLSQKKDMFDNSCKLSTGETICMKYQTIFSETTTPTTDIINGSSTEFPQKVLNFRNIKIPIHLRIHIVSGILEA